MVQVQIILHNIILDFSVLKRMKIYAHLPTFNIDYYIQWIGRLALQIIIESLIIVQFKG